jgi:hypothetical protein
MFEREGGTVTDFRLGANAPRREHNNVVEELLGQVPMHRGTSTTDISWRKERWD